MQPTQATNDTRLPRAVERQMARINARRQPAPGAESGDVQSEQPGAVAPTVTPPAGDTPPVDPRESDPAYWKQRFHVTSGLLTKERNDSKARYDEQQRQIAELTTQVQSLQAKNPPADDEVDIAQFYTPEQIKTYGEEQCRVMAATAIRAAKSHAQKLIDAAVQPLKEREQQTKQSEIEARKQAFIDALIEAKPDYETVDKDPRWLLWLAQDDENTGVQRQQLLDSHIQRGNAKGVARMMTTWEKSVALPQPPVSPSGSGAAPAGGDAPPANGPALTAPTDAEVKDFYKRSAIGKVKDDERQTFEARLKLRNRAHA